MPENQLQPFDEQAVLQELEQLHHAIQASRREREHAVAKFDSFVKGFRAPTTPVSDRPHVPDKASPLRGPWVADTPPVSLPKGVSSAPPAEVPIASTPAAASEPGPPEPPPSYDPIASLRRRLQEKDYTVQHEPPPDTWRSKSTVVLGTAAAAIIVVAVLLFALSGKGPLSRPTSSSTGAPQTTAPVASKVSPPSAVSAPVSARALRVELTTLRPVWLRVTVDDNRTLERQVPAGQRIPFEADRAIVVRAGDAGAVRVTVDGRDGGALGPGGQVVTRTFTPAPSATDRIPR